MTGLENIIAVYNEVSEENVFKMVIRRILQNLNGDLRNIDDMTIYQLAEYCYSSPTTISRLAKKLGYKNYSVFQNDLADCTHKYQHHNRLIPMEGISEGTNLPNYFMDTIDSLLSNVRSVMDNKELNRLARAMHECKNVHIYTYIGHFAEPVLQSDLFMSGKCCDIYKNEKDMLAHSKTLKSDDMVILIAPKRIYSSDDEGVIDNIHKNGAKVCVVTDSKYYAGIKKAEYKFVFDGILYSVDMIMLQIILCIISLEYRRVYIDEN